MKAVQIAVVQETEERYGKLFVLFENGNIAFTNLSDGIPSENWEPVTLPDESIFSATHNKEKGCHRN